jgi:transposase-like protein
MTNKQKDVTKAPATHKANRFHSEESARAHLEDIRWPRGPVCTHCGCVDRQSRIEANPAKKIRPGLIYCGHCRTQYTVTVGTVFEDSKIPLHKWVYAIHLLCASKKGMSSKQLERVLGVTYKTAWFMSHRIREAMKPESGGLLGGGGSIVEADETYFGTEEGKKEIKARTKSGGKLKHMNKIVSLVERGTGQVRSFHVADVTGQNLKRVLVSNIRPDTHVMTDASPRYNELKRAAPFAKHDQVNHSIGEYARGKVTTNTVEGFFSILKRGLIGTYHHVSSAHLHRYVSEFDFRYNNREALGVDDQARALAVLKGIGGKRLTYRRVNAAA